MSFFNYIIKLAEFIESFQAQANDLSFRFFYFLQNTLNFFYPVRNLYRITYVVQQKLLKI
jgi:hypothetical protein